jgi:chromate transporter
VTRPTTAELLKYFQYLGSLGFGGPVALVGYMQRDLVERRSAPAQILWFFAKAGAFVFGSGLAIVPFLYGGVVQQYGWLNDQQFLDAVAVAMLTPGPIVITVAFIGYLVASFPGAVAAAVGVFLPVYLFVVIPFPYFDRISGNPKVKAFVAGVTAAASGTIAGACFVLARRAIIDPPTLSIGLAALGLSWKFKVPEPVLIAAGAAPGLLIFAFR